MLHHYEFVVMSFESTNAPTAFMDLMTWIFRLYLNSFVIVFIYDILIYSWSHEHYVQHLGVEPKTLRAYRLYAKYIKCEF